MSISVLDLFKIGIGPSSSHTVGPMRAAHDFAAALAKQGLLAQVRRIEVKLYGSLSATGIGHGTDRAVVAGLMGARPDEVDPDFVGFGGRPRAQRAQPAAGRCGGRALRLGARPAPAAGEPALPSQCDAPDRPWRGWRGVREYLLLGRRRLRGGRGAGAVGRGGRGRRSRCAYPFDTGAELLEQCRRHGLRISEVMLANESAWRSEAETRAALQRIWDVMRGCVERGITQEGVLPGGLNVRRRAAGAAPQAAANAPPAAI